MKIQRFFLQKAYRHFFMSEEQFISETENIFGSKVDHYYVHPSIEFLKKEIVENYSFDENGIPFTIYPGTTGRQYNPVSIAQYALGLWEIFLFNSEKKHLTMFLKISDWFVDNQIDGGWQYHYNDVKSNLKSGWISAMAQGQGISVLIRAFQISGNKKYLDYAKLALMPLEKTIQDGGVVYEFDDQNWWFEEYPSPQNPGHVFNGHLYCLFGIWDFYRITKDEKSLELFNKGVNAITSQISQYDTGYWALYDQKFKDLINASYLDLQIRQLEVIVSIKEESILTNYIFQWKNYQKNEKLLLKLTCNRFLQKYLKGILK